MKRWLFFFLASTAVDAAAVETIRVHGSVSVSRHLADVVTERLASRYGDIALEWRESSSGTSFNALFEGNVHAAITCRSVERDEIDLARRLGIDLREAALGLAGVAVIVHPDNEVSKLSLDQLASLYSGRITRWLGVGGGDEPVRLLSSPDGSDAKSVFRELVLGGEEVFAAAVEYLAPDEILERAAGDPGAIGFVSMTYDRSSVLTVPIASDESEDGVLPESRNIERGTYPLRHGVWLYTIGKPEGALRDFLTFLFLHDGADLIARTGMVPVPGLGALVRSVQPRVEPVNVSVIRVDFGFRGRRLGRTARQSLLRLAEQLASSDEGLWVTGHAEPTEEGRGQELSFDRARAVVGFLEDAGIAASRIVVKARGTSEPLNPHDTLDGRRSNRRADVWILRKP